MAKDPLEFIRTRIGLGAVTVTENIKGITVIASRNKLRQQIFPIIKRGGQPVDQDDWRAFTFFYEVGPGGHAIRRAPRFDTSRSVLQVHDVILFL